MKMLRIRRLKTIKEIVLFNSDVILSSN